MRFRFRFRYGARGVSNPLASPESDEKVVRMKAVWGHHACFCTATEWFVRGGTYMGPEVEQTGRDF
jgi:hypothetical protein